MATRPTRPAIALLTGAIFSDTAAADVVVVTTCDGKAATIYRGSGHTGTDGVAGDPMKVTGTRDADVIVGDTGGIGTDLVTYAARTSYVKANLNALDSGAEDVIGDTSLVGSQYANLIHGQGGDDQIAGRDGQDTIHDGPGNDWVYGDGHGSPYLGDGGMRSGEDGENDGLSVEGVHGGSGDDLIFGDGGPNTLWGGPGDGHDGRRRLRAHPRGGCRRGALRRRG